VEAMATTTMAIAEMADMAALEMAQGSLYL